MGTKKREFIAKIFGKVRFALMATQSKACRTLKSFSKGQNNSSGGEIEKAIEPSLEPLILQFNDKAKQND